MRILVLLTLCVCVKKKILTSEFRLMCDIVYCTMKMFYSFFLSNIKYIDDRFEKLKDVL